MTVRPWWLLAVLLSAPLAATITGTVVDDDTDLPIVGAVVHVQADPEGPTAITNAAGRFTLEVAPTGSVRVTAAVVYDRAAPRNWTTDGANADNGDDIEIRLIPMPEDENVDYVPIKGAVPGGCGDCHAAQLAEWTTSRHAGAAVDPWVLDLFSGSGTTNGGNGYVYTEVHPGESGTCATCHSPILEVRAPGTGMLDEATTDAELEGITCTACHQLDAVSSDPGTLHTVGPAPATWRFPLAGIGGSTTHDYVWGPLDDVDYPFMRASHAPVFSTSLFCASCHEYGNDETGAPGQTTYTEWLASSWAVPGTGFRACQDCHMPEATEPGPIATPSIGSAPTRPGSQRRSHAFVGAGSAELAGAITLGALATADGGRLQVVATVSNLGAGHSFPTGVSIRNAFLVIEARRQGQLLAQAAGPVVPWWADDDDPAWAEGDYAGQPGTGFAKILEGTVGGVPTAPVLFVDATGVNESSALLAGETRAITVLFDLGEASAGDEIVVTSRLIYRRAFRALVVTKGWETAPGGGPIEREVARVEQQLVLAAGELSLVSDDFESGDTSAWEP